MVDRLILGLICITIVIMPSLSAFILRLIFKDLNNCSYSVLKWEFKRACGNLKINLNKIDASNQKFIEKIPDNSFLLNKLKIKLYFVLNIIVLTLYSLGVKIVWNNIDGILPVIIVGILLPIFFTGLLEGPFRIESLFSDLAERANAVETSDPVFGFYLPKGFQSLLLYYYNENSYSNSVLRSTTQKISHIIDVMIYKFQKDLIGVTSRIFLYEDISQKNYKGIKIIENNKILIRGQELICDFHINSIYVLDILDDDEAIKKNVPEIENNFFGKSVDNLYELNFVICYTIDIYRERNEEDQNFNLSAVIYNGYTYVLTDFKVSTENGNNRSTKIAISRASHHNLDAIVVQHLKFVSDSLKIINTNKPISYSINSTMNKT